MTNVWEGSRLRIVILMATVGCFGSGGGLEVEPAVILLTLSDIVQTQGEFLPVRIPPLVRAADQYANSVAGVRVTFEVLGGDSGGRVDGTTQITDSLGLARVGSWTLGGAGTYMLSATASGLPPATFVAYSIRLPVSDVIVTGPGQSLNPGATLQLTASARDSVGRPLANRVVTWSSSDTRIVTVSTTGLVACQQPGTATIHATSEGRTGVFAVTVLSAAAATQRSR